MEGKTKRKRRRKEQEDQPQSGNTDDARENGNRDSAPGFGRRGTPFDVKWNGESLAAKQFVTNKEDGLAASDREIRAYEHLNQAWGKLVPTPRFVSAALGSSFWDWLRLRLSTFRRGQVRISRPIQYSKGPQSGDCLGRNSSFWLNVD